VTNEFFNGFLCIGKISKVDHALIKVLHQGKKWTTWRLLRECPGKSWAGTSVDQLLTKINLTIRMKWQWFLLNLVPIWWLFLKLRAVKQSVLAFLAYLVV